MKKLLWIILLSVALSIPASASGIVAPEVPDDVQQIFPEEQADLATGLWHIVKEAILQTQPQVASCIKLCLSLIGSVLIIALARNLQRRSQSFVELAGVLVISCMLLGNSNALITMGTETVWQISAYGKLLLPVMTAALAAQGGSISAASIYTAAALFDTLLSSMVSSVLIPMVYIYIVLSTINAATQDNLLKKLKDLMKWIMTWCLKLILYIFTGYISVSGIISGATDQAAVKAAKLTISGMVPVVGGILSDASETILVGAGVLKNTVGIYGLLAIVAVTIMPFLSIGVHYLLLKLTAAVSSVFAPKTLCDLLDDFSGALGLVLGMTGSVCMIQLISVVFFLKGMS